MTPDMLTKYALDVKPQAFESDVFGAPVWRVELGEAAPDGRDLAEIVARAKGDGVALMSCRVPADDPASEVLRAAGFRKVERLVTLSRSLPASAQLPEGIIVADIGHAEQAAAIGQADFVYDRYHADKQIPRAVADEIKERWVRNGVSGRSDTALVAIDGDAVAGFNLCMRRREDAVIDLIGVASAYQGRGLGRRLVDAALAHYAGRANLMWVGTQDTNHASLAMYRGAGFTPQYESDTWHWTA